jgi:hypothetical protein
MERSGSPDELEVGKVAEVGDERELVGLPLGEF